MLQPSGFIAAPFLLYAYQRWFVGVAIPICPGGVPLRRTLNAKQNAIAGNTPKDAL
jgi:hypothetical protein